MDTSCTKFSTMIKEWESGGKNRGKIYIQYAVLAIFKPTVQWH